VIFIGEELTEFRFVREECEKNFENHWSKYFGPVSGLHTKLFYNIKRNDFFLS